MLAALGGVAMPAYADEGIPQQEMPRSKGRGKEITIRATAKGTPTRNHRQGRSKENAPAFRPGQFERQITHFPPER
jgi:hypothetical protein